MQTIFITGCSSGIGLQTALLLQQKGYNVYASAKKEKDVQHLKNLGLKALKVDITKYNQINDALNHIIKQENQLDVVFNNAGFGQPGAVEDVSVDVLKKQFETNVFGTHYLTCEALKIMRAQGYGKIIQHSSVLGLISLKFRGAYNASKYAIEGLNDTLRQELMGTNIYISTLNTGPVTSNFRKNALKNFQKNIHIETSVFKEVYNKELKQRLESNKDNTPFTISSQKAAKTILKIVETRKPKPRYYITKATDILGFAKRILSTPLLDKLLSRI
jgi:short-subunit dehydrogenase